MELRMSSVGVRVGVLELGEDLCEEEWERVEETRIGLS